jgi:ABC-type Na+ efflux pump permease subunit
MHKLWVIAWKEIYTRFTDRNLLLIMIAAPLAIASIVGLAFSGLSNQSSPIDHIPVAVLDLDQGAGEDLRFGALVVDLLVEGRLPASERETAARCQASSLAEPGGGVTALSLGALIDGQRFDRTVADRLLAESRIDEPPANLEGSDYLTAAARSAVDHGIFSALVILAPDFSASLSALAQNGANARPVEIEVYANPGQALAAGIVRSTVEGIASQLVNGEIAVGATVAEFLQRQPASLEELQGADLRGLFACAFLPGADLVSLRVDHLQPAAQSSPVSNILVIVGSAQAMFFALFTGQFGILSMYEERRSWTLQRMIASPTPRWAILGGKLVGTVAGVLFQLLSLVVALTAVGSLIAGRPALIWGDHFGLLALLLLGASVCIGGLGMLLAGILKGVEQANIVVSVLNIAFGVLGGAFGFTLPRAISAFSILYWGREAFERLAAGRTDIGVNLAVLYGLGGLMFIVGLVLFDRRFEI